MRISLTSLIVILYGILVVVVAGMFLFLANSSRSNERVLAELASLEAKSHENASAKKTTNQYQSMRPALVRLQSALEERSRRLREQQNEMQQQNSKHTQLQHRFEQLTKEHAELQQSHRSLLNEVDFYLAAITLFNERATQQESSNAIAVNDSADNVAESGITDDVPDERDLDSVLDPGLTEFEAWLNEQANAVTPTKEEADTLGSSTSVATSSIAAAATNALMDAGDDVVPVLGTLLSDRDPSIRAWAAWTLGNMGEVATRTEPLLQELVDDEDEEVARAAQNALEKIIFP